MKINSNGLKPFFLILIVLLILISFKPVPSNKPRPIKEVKESLFSSQRISIDEANLLIGNYLSSKNVLQATYDDYKTPKLRYFSFKAADIQDVLARLDGSDGTADKVVFKLAIGGDRRWQLVAYPMQGGNLLEDEDPATGRFSIYYNSENSNTNANPKDAGRARSNYAGRHPLRRVDGNNLLEGFSFNADQIDEIINNNGSNRTPNRLVIGIGLENPGDLPRWHVIAFGARGRQALDFGDTPAGSRLNIILASNTTLKSASVFDKADPCPPCN